MVSELRLAKVIMKISTTMKKFLKKCSKVASQLKKGTKEVTDPLFFSKKKVTKTSTKDEGLFSALIGTFKDQNIWVIDSGASRHITGQHKQLKTLSKGKSSYSVELGDNKSYPVRGIGSTSIELENGGNIHLNNILFVPSFQKKLLSISCLEDKGDRVAFINGKVVIRGRNSRIEDATMIEIREGRLYRFITPLAQAFVHIEVSLCELWHRRFGHLHYKILPTLNTIVNGIPELKEDHEGVCKGCALGKNTKRPFGSSASRSKKKFGSYPF